MIRKFRNADTSAVVAVWESASALAHPFLDSAFFESERANIVDVYLPAARTWVYETDDRVAGFISLLGSEIGGLFVDRDCQRRGIGRALVDHARCKHEILELEVFAENQIGRAFYAGYGFAEIGRSLHNSTGHELIRLRLPSPDSRV